MKQDKVISVVKTAFYKKKKHKIASPKKLHFPTKMNSFYAKLKTRTVLESF